MRVGHIILVSPDGIDLTSKPPRQAALLAQLKVQAAYYALFMKPTTPPIALKQKQRAVDAAMDEFHAVASDIRKAL